MRLLRSLLWCVTLGGLGLVALLFLVQNLHTERIVFFGLTATLNFALVVAGAVASGFLLALLLIVPGRIAAALYTRSLEREVGQLERQVAQLAEQRERLLDGREQLLARYERLFADRDKVIADLERLRAQLAAATAATAHATTKAAADERAPAVATPARQPLSLREREREAGREVRAAPVRIAPVVADEPRPASKPASARILPPAPAAPVPPAAVAPPSPVAADPPKAASLHIEPNPPAAPLASAPDPVVASSPAASDPPRDSITPVKVARSSQVRERVAHHTTAAREQLGQWRSQAGRVRRSAGARYNEMRTTLLARARAVAGSVRQLPTPSAPEVRGAAPSETSAPSASSASTASARDEDGHEHESSMLKGELPVWRPPD
ncbi:MAG TPA: LapA family protein [Ktedonobacterales bacterium]